MADVKIINHKTNQVFSPESFTEATKEFWRTHKDLAVEKFNKKGESMGYVMKPLTVEKFCEWCEMSIEVFRYFETQAEYKDACELLKTKIYARTMEGGLLGDFNATLTQKMMEQHSPKVYNNTGSIAGVGTIRVIAMPASTIKDIEMFEQKHMIEEEKKAHRDSSTLVDFEPVDAVEVK